MTGLPACLTGRVDTTDDGRIKLRADASVAVIVIPEANPAGLSKACESQYRTTRRLWVLMTDIPAGDTRNSITAEGVTVFLPGYPTPIDAGDWLPNPPETLPEVSYADIMRLLGVSVATGPADAFPMQEPEHRPPEEATTEPAPPAPEPGSFDGSQIPPALRNLNQWLCWQKPTKIPIDPRTGRNTSAPAAVWSYDECITAAEHGYGIGFSLKNGIFGVDLDHVLDENGQLKPEYAHLSEIVDKIGSYTEISPSGEGLHIFARCDDIPPECKTCRKQNVPIEMYCEKRYITVTGEAWRNPGVLRELTGDEYREIHTLLFGGAPTTGTEKPTTPPARTALPEVDFSGLVIPSADDIPRTPDHIILRHIIKRSRMLWRGDTRGYQTTSEADAALMTVLADACDYNIYQMERIFLRSGLAKREKVQSRPDYVHKTAMSAIAYVYRQNAEIDAMISSAPRWMRPRGGMRRGVSK